MEETALHTTTEKLGTERLSKLLLRLSLPSAVSMLSITLYNLVDTFWVSRLGFRSVAALTSIMPFWVVLYAVGMGTGVGANAVASRRFGEKDPESANRVAGQVITLGVGLGLLFALATTLFTVPIIKLCGATPDVIDLARQYLVILGLGTPFLFVQLIFRNMFQASGDAMRPMFFTVFGQVVNAVLDPFLIFGIGPFPEMGIAGAATATVIANAVGAAAAMYFIFANKTPYRVKPHHLAIRWRSVIEIYRVGLPTMLMLLNESVIFALFNHVIVGFGSVALAAVGIANRLSELTFNLVSGISNGLLPIVGYSLGAKLWKRLWDAVRLASLWTVAAMGVATILIEIFAPQAVGIFSQDPELIAIAVPGMRIFLSTLVFIGPTIMFITTFQGLSKGKEAMIISLGRQFLFFLPGLYGLSALMGLTGVWLSMPVSDILGLVTAGAWLYHEYRRQKRSGLWEAAALPATAPVVR